MNVLRYGIIVVTGVIMNVDQSVGYQSLLQRYSSYYVTLPGEKQGAVEDKESVAAESIVSPVAQSDTRAYDYTRTDTKPDNARSHWSEGPLENIDLPDKTFAGRSSSGLLGGEDMRSAIQGMQKDRVLQEFQYFYGNPVSQGAALYSGAEGTVIRL
jgi:hypothetical protein